MKQKFEETVSECEELHNKDTENKMIVNNLHQKLTEAEADTHSKLILESKCEKLVADKKAIKNKNDDLVKELNAANFALKSCKKELKDSTHRFNKKIEEHESKIEELTKFKIMKASEEKEFRNMKKKTEKKFKEVREKEAKLKLDQSCLDKQQKDFFNEKEITDANQNLKPDTGEHSENVIEQVSAILPNLSLQHSNSTPNLTSPTLIPQHQDLSPVEDPHCDHDPQCVLRPTHPPPHGPPTLKQYELELLVIENEGRKWNL